MVTETLISKGKKLNTKYFIHSCIAIAFMVFFRFIPPFGDMTPLGMEILGIFIGLLWAWIAVDMIWPSILGLTFIGMSAFVEKGGVATTLTAVLSNPVFQMLLWLFTFSAIIEITGLGNQLAKRLIGSKLCKGRPWVLSIFIYIAAMLVAALGNGVAAILIGWSFIYSISDSAGYTHKDAWPRMMVVGVVVAVVIGVATMPFQAGVIGPFAYLYAASNNAITSFNTFQYMMFGIIYMIITTAIFFVAARFIFRPDLSALKEVDNDQKPEPLSRVQIVGMIAFIALILVVILPSVLPAGNPVKVFLDTIGLSGLTLLLIAIVIFLRDKDGKPMITFKQLADSGIPWPAMFMIGTAIYTGSALASQGTGFTATLLGIFGPMLDGTSQGLFLVILVVITVILTQFIPNAPTSAILVPLAYPLVAAMGINPILAVALIGIVSNAGLLLPCASPNAAIMYGNSEWVSAKDVWTYGLAGVVTILIAGLILIPVGNVVFV